MWLVDDEAEDSESAWQVPDVAHHGVVDALGDEFRQQDLPLSRFGPEDSERAVVRARLIAGDLDDSLEHRGQLQI